MNQEPSVPLLEEKLNALWDAPEPKLWMEVHDLSFKLCTIEREQGVYRVACKVLREHAPQTPKDNDLFQKKAKIVASVCRMAERYYVRKEKKALFSEVIDGLLAKEN